MPGHPFIAGLADGRVIDDSIGGNSARWLNHSCQPNCEAIEDERGRVFIKAIRDVMPGDKLCIAYGLTIDEAMTPGLSLPMLVAVERRGVPVRCWPWRADSRRPGRMHQAIRSGRVDAGRTINANLRRRPVARGRSNFVNAGSTLTFHTAATFPSTHAPSGHWWPAIP
jgi:hypothetical protein